MSITNALYTGERPAVTTAEWVRRSASLVPEKGIIKIDLTLGPGVADFLELYAKIIGGVIVIVGGGLTWAKKHVESKRDYPQDRKNTKE